jgi:hypothetical protein
MAEHYLVNGYIPDEVTEQILSEPPPPKKKIPDRNKLGCNIGIQNHTLWGLKSLDLTCQTGST